MRRLPLMGRSLPLLPLVALAVVLSGVVVAVAMLWSTPLSTAPTAPVALETTTASNAADEDTEQSEASGAGDEVALPMVAYEAFLPRDPFEPVVEPEAAEPPLDENGEPLPQPDSDVDPADPADPTDPGTPGPQPPDEQENSDTRRCTGEAEVVCDGRLLILEDIRSDNDDEIAVIVVDDVTFQVQPGERFATSFELLRIDVDSARLLFGDEVFSLPLHSSVMK